jgi:hypothetical protein
MANLLTAMACYDLPVVVVLLVGDQDHPQGQGLKDLCSLRNMSFMVQDGFFTLEPQSSTQWTVPSTDVLGTTRSES